MVLLEEGQRSLGRGWRHDPGGVGAYVSMELASFLAGRSVMGIAKYEVPTEHEKRSMH